MLNNLSCAIDEILLKNPKYISGFFQQYLNFPKNAKQFGPVTIATLSIDKDILLLIHTKQFNESTYIAYGGFIANSLHTKNPCMYWIYSEAAPSSDDEFIVEYNISTKSTKYYLKNIS